jgi:hypothetical protein
MVVLHGVILLVGIIVVPLAIVECFNWIDETIQEWRRIQRHR